MTPRRQPERGARHQNHTNTRARRPSFGERELESIALARHAADLRRRALALIKQANEVHEQSQAILRLAAEKKRNRR
jgi:hypothetical protein